MGTFGDGINEESGRGRKPRDIEKMRKLGMKMRDRYCRLLHSNGLRRLEKRFYRNNNNHTKLLD